MTRMKKALLFSAVLLTVIGSCITYALDHPKGYKLTEVQTLRLTVKKQAAFLAQKDYAAAAATFQKSVNDFNDELKSIEKENGWPSDLVLNPDTLTLSDPPAKPAASTTPPVALPPAPAPVQK